MVVLKAEWLFLRREAWKSVKYQFEGHNLSLIWADGLVCDLNLSDGGSMCVSDTLCVQTRGIQRQDMVFRWKQLCNKWVPLARYTTEPLRNSIDWCWPLQDFNTTQLSFKLVKIYIFVVFSLLLNSCYWVVWLVKLLQSGLTYVFTIEHIMEL